MNSPMSTFLIKERVDGLLKETANVLGATTLFFQGTNAMVAPL